MAVVENKAEKNSAPTTPDSNVALLSAAAISHYSGPLPPADELAKYEKILPGSAERILIMAEQQAKHRHDMESTAIKGNARDQRSGVVFAFIITMTALIVGALCVLYGQSVAGVLISGSGLVSVVGAFIYGTRSNRVERQEKALRTP